MVDKRSTRDIVIAVDTKVDYLLNHVKNVDQHLNRLNERTGKCEVAIAQRPTLGFLFKLGSAIFSGIGAIVALILKLVGVY